MLNLFQHPLKTRGLRVKPAMTKAGKRWSSLHPATHEERHCEGKARSNPAAPTSGLLRYARNDEKHGFSHKLRIAMCAIALFCLFAPLSLKAQTEDLDFDIPDAIAVNDTLPQTVFDTIPVSTKTTPVVLPDNAANPHRATLWALLPGGGQIYNWNHGDKAWLATLKLTAIYGGFGTLTYFIVQNTNDYRTFRDAYKWVSSEGESGKENQYTDGYNADQLQAYMNYYQTNMEWCYFFTGLLYGLQIVEATVTAHLLTFDVSDNLSLAVKPLYLPNFLTASPMRLSLCYKIQYK